MMTDSVLPFEGKMPNIHPEAWVAPTAVVVGDVEIGAETSVWYHCVLRGDTNIMRIGARTNIQDGSILHCDFGVPLTIGRRVSLGHKVMLHGCTVGDSTHCYACIIKFFVALHMYVRN